MLSFRAKWMYTLKLGQIPISVRLDIPDWIIWAKGQQYFIDNKTYTILYPTRERLIDKCTYIYLNTLRANVIWMVKFIYWWPVTRWCRREKALVVITGLHALWLVVIVNNGFPVDWSDSVYGHLDLRFYSKTPFLLWIVKKYEFLIIRYLWFFNVKYILNKT